MSDRSLCRHVSLMLLLHTAAVVRKHMHHEQTQVRQQPGEARLIAQVLDVATEGRINCSITRAVASRGTAESQATNTHTPQWTNSETFGNTPYNMCRHNRRGTQRRCCDAIASAKILESRQGNTGLKETHRSAVDLEPSNHSL